jgi:hypothetical protein
VKNSAEKTVLAGGFNVIYFRPQFRGVNQLRSWDSSVSVGQELVDRGVGVLLPVEARDFSFLHNVQTGSEAHPASYTMDTAGCFPVDKAAEA